MTAAISYETQNQSGSSITNTGLLLSTAALSCALASGVATRAYGPPRENNWISTMQSQAICLPSDEPVHRFLTCLKHREDVEDLRLRQHARSLQTSVGLFLLRSNGLST